MKMSHTETDAQMLAEYAERMDPRPRIADTAQRTGLPRSTGQGQLRRSRLDHAFDAFIPAFRYRFANALHTGRTRAALDGSASRVRHLKVL